LNERAPGFNHRIEYLNRKIASLTRGFGF